MVKILLIRHGQASFGKENYDELSDIGHLQSELLGDHLVNDNQVISKVYCGTLQRHVETWQGISRGFSKHPYPIPDCETLRHFNELDAEALTQRHLPRLVLENPHLAKTLMKAPTDPEAFKELFEFVVNTWVAGGIKKPKIGTWQDFTKTVIEGLETVIKNHRSGETIAIVTSGGPISAIRCYIDSLEMSAEVTPALDWNLANASISKVKWCNDEQRFSLLSYNQHHHVNEQDLHTTI